LKSKQLEIDLRAEDFDDWQLKVMLVIDDEVVQRMRIDLGAWLIEGMMAK
jgi:hypothetical protein